MYPFGPRPEPEPIFPERTDLTEPPIPADEVDSFLHDPVLRWRASRLAAAGLNARQARALALDRSVDKDVVIGWIERGCDPDIAFDLASS